MRTLALVTLDKRRPALLLTRPAVLGRIGRISVAPITTTMRGLVSEVPVGPRNGLDHDSVISCDNIMTVSREQVGATLGLLFDDQEADLARAICEAFDLDPP